MTEPADGAERTDPTSEAEAAEAPPPVTVAAVGESDVLRLADPAAAGWEGALAVANQRRADAARDRLARRLHPLDAVLDIDPTDRHDEPVPITLMDRWADPDTIWAIVDRRLTLDDCRPPRLKLTPPPSGDVDDRIDMYTAFDLFRPAPADVVGKLGAGCAIALGDLDGHDADLADLCADITAATGVGCHIDAVLLGPGGHHAVGGAGEALIVAVNGPIEVRMGTAAKTEGTVPDESGGAAPAPEDPAGQDASRPRPVAAARDDDPRSESPVMPPPDERDVTTRSAASFRRQPSATVSAGAGRPATADATSFEDVSAVRPHDLSAGDAVLVTGSYEIANPGDRTQLALRLAILRPTALDLLTRASGYAKFHPLLRADLPADLDRPTASYEGSLYDRGGALGDELSAAISGGGFEHAVAGQRAGQPPRTAQQLFAALAAIGVRDAIDQASVGTCDTDDAFDEATELRCPLPGGVTVVANQEVPTIAARGAKLVVAPWLLDALAPHLDGESFTLGSLAAATGRPLAEVGRTVRSLLDGDVLEAVG